MDRMFVWIGCTTRIHLPSTIKSLEKILQSLNVPYEILDTESICCGSPLFNTGQKERALEAAKSVVELFNRKGVKDLLGLCAGCMSTFKNRYPSENLYIFNSVQHIAEFLMRHKLDLKNKQKISVTYHDPCHLGRYGNLYDEPRQVIKDMLNADLREMKLIRENSFCCGSGGGLRIYKPDMADYPSNIRLMEARETGVEYFVQTCPFCERSFRRVQELQKLEKDITIINLVDLIAKHLELS